MPRTDTPAPTCVFCAILAGEAPATIVRSWEYAIALVPLNPVTEGHVIIAPKRHVTDATVDPDVTLAVMRAVAEVATEPCDIMTSLGMQGQPDHMAVEVIPREVRGEPVPWTQEEGDCPVCFSFRVRPSKSYRRNGLATCGSRACSYELKARKTRGNVYGDRGGGPPATTDAKYSAVHARARRALRGTPCAMADETCAGRLEAALRPDAPAHLLRHDGDGGMYYFGLDVLEGYRNLCRSHHGREGALRAAAQRDADLAIVLLVQRARGEHGELCPPPCAGCSALRAYDEAVKNLHLHVIPRREGDGLALPWTTSTT